MFTWVGTPRSLLTWFYSYPWEFVSWINQVISITDNWFSILAVVLVVCLILFIFYHKED